MQNFPPNNQGFSFAKLQTGAGLAELDQAFQDFLAEQSPQLLQDLYHYQNSGVAWEGVELSTFLINLALQLQQFVAGLFELEAQLQTESKQAQFAAELMSFKAKIIGRKLKLAIKSSLPVTELEFNELSSQVQQYCKTQFKREFNLIYIAQIYNLFVEDGNAELLEQYLIALYNCDAGAELLREYDFLNIAQLRDPQNLVKDPRFTFRDGFDFEPTYKSALGIQSEIDYCLLCHNKNNDFCRKGFSGKKAEHAELKTDSFGQLLHGCPLDERISEMHYLKQQGAAIAALAMLMRDNPMCPATGHRICNDCRQACIFQKQDPVDIPQIETQILRDVLAMPWGVEIYDLFTKWLPLKAQHWLPAANNGRKIMIVGLGPAGFALAHYLSHQGFITTAIDGSAIKALPAALINNPVANYAELEEKLSEREVLGFGGVAEYGITSRWDKNFLKLIYLVLSRRTNLQLFGNLRFGGSLTIDNIWQLGFEHLCLAVGAGLPKALNIENSLVTDMRQATDFLMSLHLNKADNLTNLVDQSLCLPILVIGAGLTAVDAASEAQAYYRQQVLAITKKYSALGSKQTAFYQSLAIADQQQLDEYLAHAKLLAGADWQQQIAKLGGVHIVYRKTMQAAPAYRSNPEELQFALNQGIGFIEQHTPKAVQVDGAGKLAALSCTTPAGKVDLEAGTILVATGTNPNVAYAFEHAGELLRDGFEYQRFALNQQQLYRVAHRDLQPKTTEPGFFTNYNKDGRKISFIGDVHPAFSGSVVKALASAKRAYPEIMQAVLTEFPAAPMAQSELAEFQQDLKQRFNAKVVGRELINENLLLLTVQAPQALANFQPGQFYKLQIDSFEPVALIGFAPDAQSGTLKFLIWRQGAASNKIFALELADKLNLTGPTGVRTKIPSGDQHRIAIIGSSYVIPYLLAVGPALKAAGHQVTAFIQLDASCANLPEAMLTEACSEVISYKEDCVANTIIDHDLQLYDRISIASDWLDLQKFDAFYQQHKNTLTKKIYAATNMPMQCMLKGVCAKCLVWQKDPTTGVRTKAVFCCSWQDQPFELIDLNNLQQRLEQDRLLQKLNATYK